MRGTALAEAAAALRDRLQHRPEALVVLGSGLGELAGMLKRPVEVLFEEVPGLPAAGVPGHAGRFLGGILEGRRVLVQAGRYHLYEGHGPDVVVAPVRIAGLLGVPIAILSNAAGGVNRLLEPGSLMLVDDHVNLTWWSPLVGPVEPDETRFPDMSAPYDEELQRLFLDASADLEVPLSRGTYAAVTGPSYETAAEVRMLARLGVDAVGMSTVPEAIVARARGMRVAAVSLITNKATGLAPAPLSHSEVMDIGRSSGERLGRLIRLVVRRLPAPRGADGAQE